jgi:cytokinesis protein
MKLEEQHRRNEQSMRRKANSLKPLSSSAALSSDSDAPKSPASTGAMDDLLQKLRAAKPEARDQRDRRRRARLKDRHQVRVASGQKIPELGVNMPEEEGAAAEAAEAGSVKNTGLLSPTSEAEGELSNPNTAKSSDATATGRTTPDVADRAAAMLEGLNKDGGLNVRRRLESEDSERERRRRRRQQATSQRSEDGSLLSPTAPTIPEGDEEEEERRGSVASIMEARDEEGEEEVKSPVTTVVSPPSPPRSDRDGDSTPTPAASGD